MAILSSRVRRSRKVEATEKFIAFQLHKEWFALPILSVHRVITMGKIFGDPGQIGIGLTQYQDQELLVIDVSQRIFAQTQYENLIDVEPESAKSEQRCLIVLKNTQGELVGLPIDSQPEVRRVAKSQFVPLPSSYAARSNVRCLSSLMIQLADEAPIFLLDVDKVSAA